MTASRARDSVGDRLAASEHRPLLLAFVTCSIGLLMVRSYAAGRVGFGDSEALYASYALHPQAAYLDHPGLIGVLARTIAGSGAPTPSEAHQLTAVLASLAPWCTAVAARAMGAAWRAALLAGMAVLVVPETALGLFAMTPDLLLFFAWTCALALASLGLAAKPSSGRAAFYLVGAGLAAGIAAAAKISGLTLLGALAATYCARTARPHTRTPWPWAGLASGCLVVLPIAEYEAHAGWPMLRHRLVDTQHGAGVSLRNLGALVLGQFAYLSPLMVIIAALVAVDLWRSRRKDATSVLLNWSMLLPLAALVPLCLWSRVAEPHWIAPALLGLPLHYARSRGATATVDPEAEHARSTSLPRWLGVASLVSAGALSVAVYAWVLVPRLVALVPKSAYDPRVDIANELYGWREATRLVKEMAAPQETPGEPGSVVIVGPHWVICAQLHAGLGAAFRVGCMSPVRDDFDDWNPRAGWQRADIVLLVTDNRFPVEPLGLFPDRVVTDQRRLTIFRGGRIARTFTVDVLSLRARG
jgi:hypothetical protein